MALQDLATVEMVRNVINGTTPVQQAENATNAQTAVNAQNAQSATSAGSAATAATANKVAHKLTITMGDTTEEFDGSEDKNITISEGTVYLHKVAITLSNRDSGAYNYATIKLPDTTSRAVYCENWYSSRGGSSYTVYALIYSNSETLTLTDIKNLIKNNGGYPIYFDSDLSHGGSISEIDGYYRLLGNYFSLNFDYSSGNDEMNVNFTYYALNVDITSISDNVISIQ